ncbi:hypothetical protein BWI93_00555 [Siphonobacter sp. BAB-5385]|uniref:DUF1697 domain-containing protein n=1 Tax=Siphonobacter sp. BAB-5385 TaxID=1864822 RepID=UPI000B9E1C3C|nr:DUF1697 domain-containing protein [Siphonobacter sp. BAB-5385]OZI10049.1 hypothetical protein BWI93_00555 [Siphonobacter sp. BAB-5385]
MFLFVSLLRGINVSGQKKIPMKELKALYEELSLSEVRTYVQSGNVIFETRETNRDTLIEGIQQKISEKYGFQVSVILRTLEEMQEVIVRKPFPGSEASPSWYVTFLAKQPDPARIEALQQLDLRPEWFQLLDREVYLSCPKGYGNTKLSNAFFETKLKVTATTRNWRTINELVRLMQE